MNAIILLTCTNLTMKASLLTGSCPNPKCRIAHARRTFKWIFGSDYDWLKGLAKSSPLEYPCPTSAGLRTQNWTLLNKLLPSARRCTSFSDSDSKRCAA